MNKLFESKPNMDSTTSRPEILFKITRQLLFNQRVNLRSKLKEAALLFFRVCGDTTSLPAEAVADGRCALCPRIKTKQSRWGSILITTLYAGNTVFYSTRPIYVLFKYSLVRLVKLHMQTWSDSTSIFSRVCMSNCEFTRDRLTNSIIGHFDFRVLVDWHTHTMQPRSQKPCWCRWYRKPSHTYNHRRFSILTPDRQLDPSPFLSPSHRLKAIPFYLSFPSYIIFANVSSHSRTIHKTVLWRTKCTPSYSYHLSNHYRCYHTGVVIIPEPNSASTGAKRPAYSGSSSWTPQTRILENVCPVGKAVWLVRRFFISPSSKLIVSRCTWFNIISHLGPENSCHKLPWDGGDPTGQSQCYLFR